MGKRKSFTGCWTCRARRLKCDEVKPECTQCQAKGIKCGGYHSRLQWLRPISVPGPHDDDEPVGVQFLHRRRLLPASRLKAVSIDTALYDIEFAATRSMPRSSGPFSVFAVKKADEAAKPPAVAEEKPAAAALPADPTDESPDEDVSTDSPSADIKDLNQVDQALAEGPVDLDLHIQYGPDVSMSTHFDSTANGHPSPPASSHAMPPSILGLLADPSQTTKAAGDDEAVPARPASSSQATLRMAFTASAGSLPEAEAGGAPKGHSFLQDEVKHLLRNYAKRVLPILTPLENPRSPWREFHFPRALQCAAELEILDDTPPTRKALLHTLLTISAYNLRNLHSSEREASWKWSHAASHYKCEALRLLETCVAGPADLSFSAYTELLAAMLCMVSIDVFSGETSTSEIHLQATETLIRVQLAKFGSAVIPDSTRGLHVVFLFLRTMQEASKVICTPTQLGPSPNPVLSGDVHMSSSSSASFSAIEDVSELLVSRSPPRIPSAQSLDMVYGIPESLFLLIRKLLRALHNRNGDVSNLAMQAALDDLEDEILDWPVDDVVARLASAFDTERNRLVMQHYTRAFHQATIIFYCRKAQNMHRRHVQPYVHQVIYHMEQIELVKKNHNMCTGHIAWPAFVAGSQAMGHALQQRFVQWFDTLSREGVWTSTHCKIALLDIWEKTGTPSSFSALNGFHHLHLILT